ncbi:MAG: hypothetical protein IPG74_03460 [Flavobacteriales bacterium]|nr:hypothetical protein [Flavobacteriales bacterium]
MVDNKIDVRELKRYDKHDARKLVDRVVLDMQLQWTARHRPLPTHRPGA